MVDYREDAFQRIVNVGWNTDLRYIVLEMFVNSAATGNGFPTTIDEVINTGVESIEAMQAPFFYGETPHQFSINAFDSRQFFQYNDFQNLNTAEKRKLLIDDIETRTGGGLNGGNPPNSPNPPVSGPENYFCGTLEGFFPLTGPQIMQGAQVGYVFLVGLYLLSHPNATHFEIALPPVFSQDPFATLEGPFTKASLLAQGCRLWSGPLLDLDGAPHNPYT
jgi:hypothetical protein